MRHRAGDWAKNGTCTLTAGNRPIGGAPYLFDARDFFANEGVDDALRRAFIVYLLNYNRPMNVLAPARLDISHEFERGFQGMTDEPVSFDELLKHRRR